MLRPVHITEQHKLDLRQPQRLIDTSQTRPYIHCWLAIHARQPPILLLLQEAQLFGLPPSALDPNRTYPLSPVNTHFTHTHKLQLRPQRYHERRYQPVSDSRGAENCQSRRQRVALTPARSGFRTLTSSIAAYFLLVPFFFEYSHSDTRPVSTITIPRGRVGVLHCLQWHFAEPGNVPNTTTTLSLRKRAGPLQPPPESPAINPSSTSHSAADASSSILGLSWS